MKFKKPANRSMMLLISLLASMVSSCSSVEIKDIELCGDKGPLGAHCSTMLSNTQRDLNKDQWDAERLGQICMKSASFTYIKASLEQLCNDSQNCTYQQKQLVKQLSTAIEDIQ